MSASLDDTAHTIPDDTGRITFGIPQELYNEVCLGNDKKDVYLCEASLEDLVNELHLRGFYPVFPINMDSP